MTQEDAFLILTVGWNDVLVEGLCDAVAARSRLRFRHLVHPTYTSKDRSSLQCRSDVHFFRDELRQSMPAPDHQLLASLERDGVPTIHNMIMSDRIVSKLKYVDALSYATFLARRMIDLFGKIRPSVIVGGFDAIHGSLALAVARSLNIPWFALHFTVIPSGLACFCDRMSPAAKVNLRARTPSELQPIAENSLQQFERRRIQAVAYIAPPPLSPAAALGKIPARVLAGLRTMRRGRKREFLKFTEGRSSHNIGAVLGYLHRTTKARKAISRIHTLADPPTTPYVLFGLHMQPESSIDVWAPFFSNQAWVIELLSRSIPPSHKLLVKIHKSDTANYSRRQLERMCAFPGVELVRPFADTRSFIENAALIISIQGTMGLEAALLGKPVITLDESPFSVFPGVSRMGEILDLPNLIRRKLVEAPPPRSEIVAAYAAYLGAFSPASTNSWATERSAEEIDGYVQLFESLKQHLVRRSGAPLQKAL